MPAPFLQQRVGYAFPLVREIIMPMTASGGSYQVRFIHISDLHANGSSEKEPWRRRRVLGPAWERNLDKLLEDEGLVDFIFFTGDAAQSGQADQLAEAGEFLEDVRTRLGVGPDRLFIVPGNHDIDRRVQKDVWQRMRMAAGASGDVLSISRWMNGITMSAPFGFEADWREAILERQAAYRVWAKAPTRLGYRSTATLPGWPFPIHILGLDTSWLCGDEADAGRLLLTENQFMAHATDESGTPLAGLRIALMHHPVHELADGTECRRLMAGHVDIVLRGHLHSPEAVEWIDPDAELRELAAGCLYEVGRPDRYPNSCHFVRLELDSTGRPIEAAMRFRSFSVRGGHWFDDDSLYREAEGGRVRWKFHRKVPADPNPFSPWIPMPEQCFGRTDLLTRLETALEERRSVWLTGDSRIGKSLLLLTWEKRLKEAGRVVRLVSGETAAGVDAGSFVQSVTALASPSDADAAADRLEQWARAVGKPGLPPVILVDEIERIVETCEVRFFDRLRGMLGSVCLVFSSKDLPDRVFQKNHKTSPLTNRMEVAWAGLLEATGAEQTIALGAKILGPGDPDLLRHWCGRHPFFLQLLGYKLGQGRRQGGDMEEAKAEFVTEASQHLKKIWEPVPEPQKRELRDSVSGAIPCRAPELFLRGLVRDDGMPFGEILRRWIRGELSPE